MDCQLSADDAFGPAVHGCRSNFDFTLFFEQLVFQIIPSALLLLFLPLRAVQLRRQNVKTLRSGTQWCKQLAILALAGIQLALLVLWAGNPSLGTKASVPAAALSFLASLALLVLSTMEHSRSIRPSSLLNGYLLFSLLLDVPQTRTLWLRPGPRALVVAFTAGVAVKTIVLYLEALSKKRYLRPPYRLYAPESLGSLYDRTVAWWLNPLFLQGYKGFISFDTLTKIDADLSSEMVEADFQRYWPRWRKAEGKRPLFWALTFSLKETLAALVIPRLCLSAFKLCQPLLIRRTTSLLGSEPTQQSRNDGRGLIGATLLIYLGLAISNAMYKRQLHRFLTKLRGCLIAAVHGTSLSSPSDKLSDNAALTLISADVNRIGASLQRIEDLFATPIEVGAAIFLLQRQIGVSCVAPVALSVIITTTSFYNSNHAIPMQKKWLNSVQERVSYTSSMLSCPKGFKMLGLGPYLSSRIQALRIRELADYAGYRKYTVYRNWFSHIPMAGAPVVTLMMFTLINADSALTPSVAFTTLSLVALLTSPIQELIHAVPMFQTALASLDRIQAFLVGGTPTATTRGEISDAPSGDESSDRADNVALNSISHAAVHNASLGVSVLRLENARVRLGIDNKLVLSDLNIKIIPGTINLIIGPVGCGKSTLLKTMIGDLALDSGQLLNERPPRAYAYCAQEPWLPNDTFRNLVLSHSDMDSLWYTIVVQACALQTDISGLANGDETVIGNKGVSLSGGQKQRLALARALYSRKDILFVDDCLSGLDSNTSRTVFDNVFGVRGLCKRHGITVVFATHAIQYLLEADNIIAIGESGQIVEQGSYEELQSRGGYVHSLSVKERQLDSPAKKEHQDATRTDLEKNNLVDAEQDLARRTGDMAVYRYYAKSIGWWYGSIIVLTGIAFGFGETFPALWVRWWSEAEASNSSNHTFGYWIGIYFFLAAISLFGLFAQIWVMLVVSVPRSSAQLHKQLLNAVMRAPYSFFVNTDSGVTLNRFSNDMNLIETELAGAVMITLAALAICTGAAALIAAGAKYAGVAMPFVLAVLYAIQKFYLRTSRQLRFMDLESQAPLLTHCSETISGVTTIRAFGWQNSRHAKCLVLLDNSQRPYYLLLCIQRWLNLVLDLTTGALAVIVVALAMTLRSSASAGSVGLSMLQILSFNTQMAYLITAWTTLETALGAVARCKNFEKTTVAEDLATEIHVPPAGWPEAGTMQLENLSASYKPDGEDVLKNIALSIAPGEKLAICGRTGSGKSSLLLTILRLLDHRSGSITLDGIDLTTVPRQTIRERVTALPQEVLTFPGSLRDNIDPLHLAEDVDVRGALQKTGLLGIIDERGGLDTDMSALGLSQGQLQLFAVARALLRKSKLFILDEMSSSLDSVTEEMVVSLVQQEFSDSTVIAVAHKLKTIIDFDRIMVMDRGSIVELGSPSELLAKENGIFRAMWERS